MSRRYSSAKMLSEELNRYLTGMPIEARPIGTLGRLERWCRRNPLVALSTAAAFASLLFGMVAASIGYVRASRAQTRAEIAQARAETSSLEARQAVDDLFTRVSEETLLKHPGMQPLRSDLLRRARDYYEKFLVESDESESVRDQLALAHYRVGLITEEIDSPAKAMPSYDIAVKTQKELADKNPEDAERLHVLGDTLNAIGRALQKQQQIDRALEAYAAAIDVRSRLAAMAPDSREYKRTLANSWMNIGLAEREKNTAQARKSMEKAQALRLELLASDKNDEKVRRDLAMGYFNLGDLCLENTDIEIAEKCLENAQRLFVELGESNPDDINLAYLAAILPRKLGDMQCMEKQYGKAIQLYGEARNALESLAAKNPTVTDYQAALAEIYINLAEAEFNRGDSDAMLVSFNKAEKILSPLVAQHGETSRYRHDLIVTLVAIGKFHPDPSHRQQTLKSLETLRHLLENLAADAVDPSTLNQQREMIEVGIKELRSLDAEPKKDAEETPGNGK